MARKRYKEEPIKITQPIRQARFYCTPGIEPIGYRSNGIEIMREPKETLEELRSKCKNAVEWPDTSTQHSFIPITI